MRYIERLLKRQKINHAEKIKELTLSRVFHEENRVYGFSEERIEGIKEELLMLKEELAQLEFLADIVNEGELKRIYSINQQTKRGEKIS